jgi:hypothetical protein
MKRFLVFILLGPALAVATLYVVILPLASLLEHARMVVTIERENVRQIVLLLVFLGFVLWLFDWVTGMMDIPHRPLIVAIAGWCLAWFGLRGYLALPDIPGWPIAVGLVGALPACACSWLSAKIRKPGTI